MDSDKNKKARAPRHKEPLQINNTVDDIGQIDVNDEQTVKGMRFVPKGTSKLLALFVFTCIYGAIIGAIGVFWSWLDKVIALYAWLFFHGSDPAVYAALAIPHVLVFLGIGYMFRARWMAFIPLLAFEMQKGGVFGWLIPNSDFFRYLAHHYSSQENPSFLVYSVPFAFMLAFTIILGLRYLAFIKTRRRWVLFAAAGGLFSIALVSLLAINKVGTPLYHAELRHQDLIHLPSTDSIYGTGTEIIYAPIQHANGVFQDSDDVQLKKIFPTNKRSSQKSCGGNTQKTDAGHEYTTKTVIDYKGWSSTRGAIGKYTTYTYCFVIGSYRYSLIRSDEYGAAYLQKYPAGDVIDAVNAGPSLVYGCSNSKVAAYCDQQSTHQAHTLISAAQQKKTVVCENPHFAGIDLTPKCDQIVTKGKVQASKQVSYHEVARLTIPEWGISVPLTGDTKDMYYVALDQFMSIGLRKYDSSTCSTFAGKLKPVGSLSRVSKDSLLKLQAQNPNTKYQLPSGKDLGDGYLYTLDAIDEEFRVNCGIPDTLIGTFKWMQDGIKKL